VALPIDGLDGVALGFEFDDAQGVAGLADTLPPAMARHAAVALSLVSEQLRLERELAALRSTEAERTGFVSTVAHELRTPLTALSGYLDLILEGRVDDPAVEREFLERGRSIVGSMGDLVGDLLEWSRLEAGSLRLELAAFSLKDAVGRVAASLMPIALERGVELGTALPPRLRAATGDRRRVEQIITNVAANALKFTPAGRSVELAAWFDGSVALVAVRDEGSGIAADDRARIFERFYRMAGHDKITGTGLGLPIARELARAMGGDLDVASVPGSGSSFVLALPGPAPAAATNLAETLERVLGAEEVGLDERAVLRAMQHAGHGLGRPA
jgi:signal transduction histidine kinase